MDFEFVIFAIIALVVLFIVERIYRKVLENNRQIDMQRRKFTVMESRLTKQSKLMKELIKQSKSQIEKKNNSVNNNKINNNNNDVLKGTDVIKCPKCRKYYSASLNSCPYCDTVASQ